MQMISNCIYTRDHTYINNSRNQPLPEDMPLAVLKIRSTSDIRKPLFFLLASAKDLSGLFAKGGKSFGTCAAEKADAATELSESMSESLLDEDDEEARRFRLVEFAVVHALSSIAVDCSHTSQI